MHPAKTFIKQAGAGVRVGRLGLPKNRHYIGAFSSLSMEIIDFYEIWSDLEINPLLELITISFFPSILNIYIGPEKGILQLFSFHTFKNTEERPAPNKSLDKTLYIWAPDFRKHNICNKNSSD